MVNENGPQGHLRYRAYLAGPLFSQAERDFNEDLASKLETHATVYLPQRDGGLMSDMVKDGVSPDAAARRVFRRDMDAIRSADCLIAILDGRTIDEGVAFELGIGFCHSKRCVGLQTDSRRLASWGNNPMITGALEAVFLTVEDLLKWMKFETTGQPGQRMTCVSESEPLVVLRSVP
ncbi:MAG: nucleoside 2-deoxyribosyltransferase [Planctomycetota bacterium]